MADETVIREFLVKLGFRTDDASIKKFNTGVSVATKSVLGLGAAIAGMAIGAVVSTIKFSKSLEDMYFAAKRTNSTASHVEALRKTAQDFGVSAEAASGSVENLRAAFLDNPAKIDRFGSLFNVKMYDEAGKVRDLNDIMMEASAAAQKMPSFQARRLGSQFGIDPEVMSRMLQMSGALEGYKNHINALAAADWDGTVKKAHDLEVELRALDDRWKALKVTFAGHILKIIEPELKRLDEWFKTHPDEIKEATTTMDSAFKTLGAAGGFVFHQLAEDLKSVKATFSEVSTWLEEHGMGPGSGGWMDVPGNIIDKVGKFRDAQVGGMWGGIKGAYNYLTAPDDGTNHAITGGAGFKNWMLSLVDKAVPPQEIIRQMMLHAGYQPGHAAAAISEAMAESGLDPKASNPGHKGIFQWDAEGQEAFKKFSGKDISKSSVSDQMEFFLYDLQNRKRPLGDMFRSARDTLNATNLLSYGYERYGAKMIDGGVAEAQRRSDKALSINTTINISGMPDPQEAKRVIGAHVDRINQSATRSLKTGVK